MESDFSRFDNSGELRDICGIEISPELSTPEKLKEFIRQTGSSTSYKVGVAEVECVYGSLSVKKMLNDLIHQQG